MADEVGKIYTVSDGDILLTLEVAEEGGFVVRAPMEPGVITQAETIEEAFYMARDAREALREVRQRYIDEAQAAMTKAG